MKKAKENNSQPVTVATGWGIFQGEVWRVFLRVTALGRESSSMQEEHLLQFGSSSPTLLRVFQ